MARRTLRINNIWILHFVVLHLYRAAHKWLCYKQYMIGSYSWNVLYNWRKRWSTYCMRTSLIATIKYIWWFHSNVNSKQTKCACMVRQTNYHFGQYTMMYLCFYSPTFRQHLKSILMKPEQQKYSMFRMYTLILLILIGYRVILWNIILNYGLTINCHKRYS